MTNPEFKRNLWLQLSLHRVIAMPVILGLIFLAAAATSSRTLANATMPAFVLLVWLWGTRNVSAAIVDELRDKTWDQQRMSALSPWTMTWGKLFGASAFSWYGGAICLAVAIAAAVVEDTLAATIRDALIMIAVAVLLHASSLALNLHAGRMEAAVIQRGGVAWLVVILGLILFPWSYSQRAEVVRWWGASVSHTDFLLLSCIFFAAWAVFAAWRVMSNALQVRTLPWAWPLFTVVLTAYIAGFGSGFGDFLRIGVLVAGAMTYAALFTEPNGIPVWQRTAVRFRKGDVRGALEALPIWVTSLTLAFLFAILGFLGGLGKAAFSAFPDLAGFDLLLPAVALTVLRDAFVLLFFAFGKNPKRVEATTLLYLVIINGLLPFLANVLHLDGLRYLLFPVSPPSALWSTVIMSAHAAVAIGLVCWRWRNRPRFD